MADAQRIQQLSPLEINAIGSNRIEALPGIPEALNGMYGLPGFDRLHATGGFGAMTFFHFAGAGFDIWHSNYAIDHNAQFIARGNFPALELHIPIKNHFVSWWDGRLETGLRDKQFELSYFPFIDSRPEFAGGQRGSAFDIHYSPVFCRYNNINYPTKPLSTAGLITFQGLTDYNLSNRFSLICILYKLLIQPKRHINNFAHYCLNYYMLINYYPFYSYFCANYANYDIIF